MNSESFKTGLQIAKVLKSDGTDGGMLWGFRNVLPEDLTLTEPVFIHFDGLPVPFFIESFNRKGRDKAIVRLTDINSLADAEEIVGRIVYAEEDTVEGYEDDGEMSLEDFVGWTIFNRDVHVGEVVDYEDIPGNPCLYVDTENGQAMIPLHEDFILSVDLESREMSMDLPDGLV